MPAHVVALVVIAVITVVSTVMQMQDANKQEKARKEALRIQAAQRELNRTAQDLRLKRDARKQEAMLINAVAKMGGVESSSFSGATQAVKSNLARELQFSEQGATLASEADDITARQISIDASRQSNAALFSGITKLASLGAQAGSLSSPTDPSGGTHFGSTSGADSGDVFSDQVSGNLN